MSFYLSLFPGSRIKSIIRWGENELGAAGSVQHAAWSRRLPSLPPKSRTRCRRRVEARLGSLTADELVYRPTVIGAAAYRPA